MFNLLHNLLSLKHVLILQKVYRLLLERFETAIITLSGGGVKPFLDANNRTEKTTKLTAKKTVLFVLAAISNIATAKGSVLSMWALEPSIFIVLCDHAGLADAGVAVGHPAVHHAMLRLLLLHSSAHTFYQGFIFVFIYAVKIIIAYSIDSFIWYFRLGLGRTSVISSHRISIVATCWITCFRNKVLEKCISG